MNPHILSRPLSEIQVQKVGDLVKLNCSARGLPLPKVKWLKDGSIVSTEAHSENDVIISKVVIQRFKPSDAGIYTCLFENDKNERAEANTSLSMLTVYSFCFATFDGKLVPGFKEKSFCDVIFQLSRDCLSQINTSRESVMYINGNHTNNILWIELYTVPVN